MEAGLLSVLKALADSSRLRILGLLSERERSVGAIAEALKLTEPTISHHLGRLVAVGLVVGRAEGTSRIYALDDDSLSTFQRSLSARPIGAADADVAGASADEAKVLKAFLRDGRLVKIPESLKKRRVVLGWLVAKLDHGHRYPEKEINAFLKRYHEDFATLRRELVDGLFMRRENGIYWRT